MMDDNSRDKEPKQHVPNQNTSNTNANPQTVLLATTTGQTGQTEHGGREDVSPKMCSLFRERFDWVNDMNKDLVDDMNTIYYPRHSISRATTNTQLESLIRKSNSNPRFHLHSLSCSDLQAMKCESNLKNSSNLATTRQSIENTIIMLRIPNTSNLPTINVSHASQKTLAGWGCETRSNLLNFFGIRERSRYVSERVVKHVIYVWLGISWLGLGIVYWGLCFGDQGLRICARNVRVANPQPCNVFPITN